MGPEREFKVEFEVELVLLLILVLTSAFKDRLTILNSLTGPSWGGDSLRWGLLSKLRQREALAA